MPCLVEPYFLSASRASSRRVQIAGARAAEGRRGQLIFRFSGVRETPLARTSSISFHRFSQVQRDAVAQDVYNALAENAGGQQMQGKFAVFIDDGVARVAAALIADYDVIVAGSAGQPCGPCPRRPS